MESETITMPESGEGITVDKKGLLVVPLHPIIPFVKEEDAEGLFKLQAVLDAVIDKVYAGKRRIVWLEIEHKIEHKIEPAHNYPVSLNFSGSRDAISNIYASVMMLKRLDWHTAADCLQNIMNEMTAMNVFPEGFALLNMSEPVSKADFYAAMIENMHIGEDMSQYDALADKFHQEFEENADNTAEFAKKTMDKAREQLNVAGKYTEEQSQKFKIFLENDFSRVTQEIRVSAKEKLNPSRLGTGFLSSVSTLLHKTGVALSNVADKADDALTCKSGEITSAGTLACHACGYEMNFKKTGRIPPCPKCHKTEFKKGY